jgi:hypothetical protein
MPPRKFDDKEKWCPRCTTTKLHREFGKDSKRASGLQPYCKLCSRKVSNEHYQEHPRQYTPEQMAHIKEKASRWNKENSSRRRKQKCNSPEGLRFARYGLTPEEYAKMFSEQGGKCAIPSCNGNADFVDHDHETNIVRRLLCRLCNSGLGFFRDSPQLLREATEYLENFGRN